MFSERIQKLRKEKRLTQEEISHKLGISRTTYSGYERGTSEPDFKTLISIADFFEVTLDYLIGRTDDPHMWFKNENEKTIYDIMDLSTDDEILDKFHMTYDGVVLTLSEKKEFIAIARGIFDVRRSLKENSRS